MRVTTKGRYALRAMLYLALEKSTKPVSIKTMAGEENISPIFLEQIFTKLKTAGLVKSVRGAKGGFILAKKAGEISVLHILDAVEEGIELTPCCAPAALQTEECLKISACASSRFWLNANQHFNEYFSSFSLQNIIETLGTDSETD